VQNSELWGIARIFSPELVELLGDHSKNITRDTSPGVQLAGVDDEFIDTPDGSTLLIEGEPQLIDHLAIVLRVDGEPGGVWSRGDPANSGFQQEVSNGGT
jgi:hypothetical protein